jgi:NAD(P)-dependent dehydrogenase (short-subunit alcohol dehydrogenase family)
MSSFLVTGASSGIGAATALHLDADGHRVFAGVGHADDGVAALSGGSDRLRRVVLDVTSAGSIRDAVATVAAQVGPDGLDGVVNNAGIALAGLLELLPIDDLRHQLDADLGEGDRLPRPARERARHHAGSPLRRTPAGVRERLHDADELAEHTARP